MFQYPLSNINKELWHKKIQATLMFSIPAEDEALPILYEFVEVLENLNSKPIEDVLAEDAREYFFNEVFPQICTKIIKSRYFKNQIILTLSNKILANSLQLYPKYLDMVNKYPGLNEILVTVLSSDQYYFKSNNQLDYKLYVFIQIIKPHYYFENVSNIEFANTLKTGDLVDVIKSSGKYDKLIWTRGKVIEINELQLIVQYLYDDDERTVTIDKQSFQVAPFMSKSVDFDWRMGLKAGDIIDCQDHFGGWYHGTILKTIDRGDNKKCVKVAFKVYDECGNKVDEKGKFYGFSDQQETIDVTTPRIMPFCSTCKYRNYEISKSTFQTDDSNDMVFQQIAGQKIYSLPRKRALSQFYFKELNQFGRLGGFSKPIQKLLNQINFQFLCGFVKAMGNVCPNLHKQLIIELVENLKIIVEKHLFANSDIVTKEFTKQRSEALFSGLKSLMKRLLSIEEVQKFQNSLKMKLVSQCLDSQALKRKLQGLHELKDIVRGIHHISQKTKVIKNWIIQEKIFEKVYIQNSHVQLIKKSQDFFKFLISEDILQVKDLQRLYKIAQKGDYQSRVSLYKLFQQMSHVFNKSHVEFLIDTILQSQTDIVLNEDIDMLHDLSKYSNYFPKEKVKAFFEHLILIQTKNKDLNEYAIKKYSQIVAKGYEMKGYRRQIISNFVGKLGTKDSEKSIKLLKGIFDGLGVGEWGKKDLVEIIEEMKIEEKVVKAVQENCQKPDSKKMINQILSFELFLLKLSHRIKIKLQTLKKIWEYLRCQKSYKKDYYEWLNKIMECDQGIQDGQNQKGLQQFYRSLFNEQNFGDLTKQQFVLARNLFVEINKQAKSILVSNIIRDKQIQKEYRRKCGMNSLRLLGEIEKIIYNCKNKEISDCAFKFFLELYSSKENTNQEINDFLAILISKLQKYNSEKDLFRIQCTINFIQMVINDSEKYQEIEMASMIKCRKGALINVTLINDVSSYISDTIRKQNLFQKSNISLLQLKNKISSKVSVPVEELKVIGKYELSDYYNSYTLAELNISNDQPLTVSRRMASSMPQQELILDGALNPKAVRIFKMIFEKYATHNDQMSKEDYNKFTSSCLGTYSKNYYDKITPIYAKHDSNHDGLLSLSDFLNFYTQSATDKPSTVWSNLKNLGVRGNFKFKDQPEDRLTLQQFPRYKLYNNQQFYQILFTLLEEKQISKSIYNFLLRLPPNKSIYEEIKNIWVQYPSDVGKENLEAFLQQKSKFRLMYKLILILNILQFTSSDSNNSLWNVKFSLNKGYEVPWKVFKTICNNKQQYSQIQLDIIQLIFQIVKDYVYNAFGTKQSIESNWLFEQELTIEQKMEYLMTGVYPKSYSYHKKDSSFVYRYEWEDEKDVFMTLFISIFLKIKNQLSNVTEVNQKSVILSMISKLMAILSALMVNQPQRPLLPIYPLYFNEVQHPKLLNEFYTMILCICCNTRVNTEQHVHIHEFFKYIKCKHITSEHFRILAFLVSKFGFKEENVSEIPEVLLRNILQEQNQPTIEGCAKLLVNFDVSQLNVITPSDVEKIFDRCLFGSNITCTKQPARNQIYELLTKISESHKTIAESIVKKTKDVILQNMPLMKVVYSSEVNKRSSYGYAGLKNLGNICYMNSMIQQLFVNKTFRYLLLRIDDKKELEIVLDQKGEKVDDNLLHQIQRIFAYLQKTTRQDFSPSAFCIAYKPFGQSVNIMMQQDVQQFVSMFFDRLQAGISQHPLKNLIQNFYTGKTANLFKCHNCKRTKKIQQNFHSISLEVKNSKNLSESFNKYALGEVINDYRCDFCEQKSDVSKMTRISKLPQLLIIHLQRIVFNLDTFINQKITSKHEFPMDLNVYNYTIEHFDKQQSNQPHQQVLTAYDYQLTGIIIHNGNAESGHYISFIKTQQNKWLQFNDSIISLFSAASIQAECFGGFSSAFQDDFQWEKKQSSKSAYLLIYNRKIDPKIQLVIREKQQSKKQQILAQLLLQEQSVQKNQNTDENSTQKMSQPTESQQQTGSAFEDSQKQREKQKVKEEEDFKQIQMIKQKKSQDRTKVDYVVEKNSHSQFQTIKIKNNMASFIPDQLENEIVIDNRVHFFQTSLASQGFSSFFAKIISIPHLHSQQLIRMCQKLTFTFWLKSKSFKRLLQSLEIYLKSHPESVDALILKNDQLITLLIQNSSVDIRSNVGYFLANVLYNYAQTDSIDLYLTDSTVIGKNIFQFLDKLFQLISTAVTKCWTKFSQYFQFWYFVAEKTIFSNYMVSRSILKHFIDYFLDKKSPLKIYSIKKVQQIGSSYANPDFSMLLRCASTLLNYYFSQPETFKLTEDDHAVLLHFQFIQKLISECYQDIAAKMAKQLCPNNQRASEKFAVVMLKGFSKSTYQNVQKYIEVLKEFVTIQDDFQKMRMEWVLGKQTLNVSTMTKSLSALNSKTMEERLYLFEPSLYIEQGASLLEPIFQLNKRVQNFCILCVQGVLQICLSSKPVRDYVLNLGPPTLVYSKYFDFYEQFIDRYIEESKRSYYSTVTHFNKTQLGLQVKQTYKKLMQIRKQEEKTERGTQNQKVEKEEESSHNELEQEKQMNHVIHDNYVAQEDVKRDINFNIDKKALELKCYQNKKQGLETEYRNINRNILVSNDANNFVPEITQITQNNQHQQVIQFLNGSFTKKNESGQSSDQAEVFNSPLKSNSQTQQDLLQLNCQQLQSKAKLSNQAAVSFTKEQKDQNNNFVDWEQVTYSDEENKKDKKKNAQQIASAQNESNQQQMIPNLHFGEDKYEAQKANQSSQPQITQNRVDAPPPKQNPFPYDIDNNQNIYAWQQQLQQQVDYNPYATDAYENYYTGEYTGINHNQDVESNKNNSRKSQLQGNDSRQQDFNGIQMKQMKHIMAAEGKSNENTLEELSHQESEEEAKKRKKEEQLQKDLQDTLQLKEKKSSDWSHQSNQQQPVNLVKIDEAPLGKRKKQRGLKIHSKSKLQDNQYLLGISPPKNTTLKSTMINSSEGEDSEELSDENEPFIKHNQVENEEENLKNIAPTQQQVSEIAYHPVRFDYKQLQKIPVQKQMHGIEIVSHQSKVTYIQTKPNNKTNKAFEGNFASGKLYNRIKDQFWKTKKQETVMGYYISNYSRLYLRVQTLEGCQLIKPNESGWIWSEIIVKMWKCERSTDWPDWSMFS